MNHKNILVEPVKKYAPPKYPTHTESRRKPELLRKLPSRWQKNAAVAAAAGLFGAMTLASCGVFEAGDSGESTSGIEYTSGSQIITEREEISEILTEQEEINEPVETEKTEEPDGGLKITEHNITENYLNVGPVFIHGEGTGSMGCVMVAPAVFLSEQEALAIIKSISESEGLKFEAEPPGYIAAQNRSRREAPSWQDGYYILGEGNIGLDLYDSENQVAVAYIAMTEAREQLLSNKHGIPVPTASVSSFFPRELAELTVEAFARQYGDINIGVLYEPGYDRENEEIERLTEEFHEKSNALWEIYRDTLTELMEKNYEEYIEKHSEYSGEFQVIRDEYQEQIKLIIAENLRSQARDFIKWLQGQGII